LFKILKVAVEGSWSYASNFRHSANSEGIPTFAIDKITSSPDCGMAQITMMVVRALAQRC
jgi:hypothetical protein